MRGCRKRARGSGDASIPQREVAATPENDVRCGICRQRQIAIASEPSHEYFNWP
jgi:hypothetical protein